MRKLFLLILLLIPLTAQGQQTNWVPSCSGSNDTAAFSAIITAIGSNLGTIQLPYKNGTRCAVNNLTIPANVTLDNHVGVGIKVNTGQTLTIVGPVVGPPKQFFYNATAGLGTVALTGNSVQKNFWVEWWGAVGDNSTDDTAALNAAFVAWPNSTTMHLCPRKTYRNTGVTIDHKAGVTLLGIDSQDGYDATVTSPRFTYVGTNGGTHLTLNNCYSSTFRGFQVYGAPSLGATGAAKNVLLNMTVGGVPPISSQDVFQSLFVVANNTRSDYIGLDIDNAGAVNNEFHGIRDCKFIGGQQAFPNQTGKGVSLGHSNVKQIRIERTTFSELAVGIFGVGNPSFRGYSNSFSACGILYSGAFGDSVQIVGDDSESCTQIWDATNMAASTPVTITGGRYETLRGGQTATGDTSTAPIISVRSTRLVVIGNRFEPFSAFNSNFIIDASTGGSTVLWKQNNVGTISAADFRAGLDTFGYFESDLYAVAIPSGLAVRGAFGLAGESSGPLTGATPSLVAGNASAVYNLSNGGAVTVTNFTNGYSGQIIVLVGDANTTIGQGATIETRSGANITPFNGKTNSFILDGTVWRQLN